MKNRGLQGDFFESSETDFHKIILVGFEKEMP